ncbi:MAG TPA: hypothetical protein VFQ11_07300 [Nocardioidaceae bacterium]|nr:hypothetical protein [Nocardioidaceae bacterium]
MSTGTRCTTSWFLLDGSGAVVARFPPGVVPDDPRVISAVDPVVS